MIWRLDYDLRDLDFDFCRRIGDCVLYGPEIRKKAVCPHRYKTAYHTRHFVGGEEVNERTLKDIESELKRARRKHPLFASTEPRAVCIIAEEFGEMAQAVNDSLALGRKTEEGEKKMLEARMEALHVIATCVRFLEEI